MDSLVETGLVEVSLQGAQTGTTPRKTTTCGMVQTIGVSPAAGLAQWKRALSMIPGLSQLAWLQIEPEFDPYKYNSFATYAAEQVFRLTRSVTHRLASLDGTLPPVLALKSTVDATVSNRALIERMLSRLRPNRHELVLFDINRSAAASILLVDDPGPHTARLMQGGTHPFAISLVTNSSLDSREMEVRYKPALSEQVEPGQELAMLWPPRVLSLSHVALPFPPDDPLYGRDPPVDSGLFLGQLGLQGERGLMRISSDWLLRMRHNPFYDYLEQRVLDWVAQHPGVR